ncbi:MAG: hypothetical protein LBQ66_10735 [Planctomycetaceae bacterium]|jgi:hypothetical protein|nr:hypothetical protein [Planctomycetaceae bacterium]
MKIIGTNCDKLVAFFLVNFLIYCGVVCGDANDDSRLVTTILNDYKANVNSLKRVEFRHEAIDCKRQKEPDYCATTGIFKYDGKSAYLQEKDHTGESERLVADQDYYIRVLNEIDESNKSQLMVFSIHDFKKLKDRSSLKSLFANWREMWGEICIDGDSNVVDLCSLSPSSIKLKRESGLFILQTFLEKNGGDLEITFIFFNGKYRLKGISFRRTQMTGKPPKLDYYSFKIEKYIDAGDTYFPAKFAVEVKIPKGRYIDEDGDECISRGYNLIYLYSITDFSINDAVEEIPRTLQTHIPNGTVVHVQDVPQIKHVWIDGKIVPWTDENALESIRGSRFVPSVREIQFWLIVSGFVLFLLGIGSGIWKHIKSRNSGGE